jgi:hypothetical protein
MADQRFDPRIPFSRADARRAGISADALRGTGYRRLFHDRYVSAEVPVTPLLRARAALAVGGRGSHISHGTAATFHGGVVPPQGEIHYSVPNDGPRSTRRGLRAHRASSHASVALYRGIPMSTPPQCVLDLAAELSLVDLVVLGDSLVRAGAVTPEELIDAAASWRGSGARKARRAMALVRADVDSPMETRVRLLIIFAGLPEPVVACEVHDEDGRFVARLDLYWPQWRVAVEYDGRQHAESTQQWERDLERREGLDRMACRLVVVRSGGVFVDPLGTLQRIVAAIADQGVVGVRIRSDAWRQHFPGRRAAA